MLANVPNSVIANLLRFAVRQSPEEMARQYASGRQTRAKRRTLIIVAFATALPFLPLWLCILLGALDLLCDFGAERLLHDLDPGRQPRRYLTMMTVVAASQGFLCLVGVLCWQLPDPMAKAYATGAMTITLMELTSIRIVHFPMALVCAATIILSSALGNGWYWVQRGDLVALLVSTGIIAAGSYFAVTTMLSVHATHAEMLRERAAAQAADQAADQAKSRFLAQMSHELRTPLNAIIGIGNAEWTLSQTVEGRARLAILVQAARGLSVMLDDILDMSAVQAGQLPIRPRPLDLVAEIAATVALFRPQVEDAGLTLRLTLHDALPQYARVDGQRLRQCLSNILSNAVKHTEQGMISVYAYEHQPGVLAVKVTDSGPGVPDALREKIFEPFYRGQFTVPGSGLGMSIGRTLARRLGGDLVLVPSVSGAHFLLTLRFDPAQASDLPAPDAPAGAALAGLRVLVVDDIATNRMVAITYLRHLGATPVEAASGAQALALIEGEMPPDMVLTDLLMPGMDGRETLRRIRALPGGAALPVIAMSAESTGPQDKDAGLPGFDGSVIKPLSADTLYAVLAPLVQRTRLGHQVQPGFAATVPAVQPTQTSDQTPDANLHPDAPTT